jgi:mannose-6-phosphate isomerase-like protein (cupin superfamily)
MRRSAVVFAFAAALGVGGASAQNAATDGPRLKAVRVVDNERVTVLRLTMPPKYRDPVTSGQNDLVVTQIVPGEVEIVIGSEKTTARREVGESWFVARGTPHAFSNPGDQPFEVTVVVIK